MKHIKLIFIMFPIYKTVFRPTPKKRMNSYLSYPVKIKQVHIQHPLDICAEFVDRHLQVLILIIFTSIIHAQISPGDLWMPL